MKYPPEVFDNAADCLRRHEMPGRVLTDWDKISPRQKKIWRTKVLVVIGGLESDEKETVQ